MRVSEGEARADEAAMGADAQKMAKKLCIYCCETLRREVETVVAAEDFDDVEIAFFPERCGALPRRESGAEADQLGRADCDRIEVLGGGCACAGTGRGPAATDGPAAADGPAVADQPRDDWGGGAFSQCFYLVADRRFVDEKQREGAYLVTPGWLETWRERLETWGFDGATARDFFRESCNTLLLLDTGVLDDAPGRMKEFAEFVDRPYGIHYVGTGYLALALTRVVARWYREQGASGGTSGGAPNAETSQRKTSDYALLLEMIGELTQTHVEDEVVEKIVGMFTMLFGSRRVVYVPLYQGEAGEPRAVPESEGIDRDVVDRYVSMHRPYVWLENDAGFALRIPYGEEIVAVVVIDEIAFPEYRDHYLNLALGIVSVCGLAIANARKVEEIRTDLRHKKTLLREIHHRVKNNMMSVTGLLNLSIMNSDDEAVRTALLESRNRIQSISLIHESLYRTETLSSIDMGQYLRQLADAVLSGFGKPDRIDLRVEVDDVFLAVKQGTPIGLVVNELITNCMKYAFPDGRRGEITLRLESTDEQIRLRIRDNGIGIPPDTLRTDTKSFGLVLVRSIIEEQLEGTVEIQNNNGTDVLISFMGDFAE